jgi:hypothetical protein
MDLDLEIECLEQIIYCNEELHKALLDNDYKKILLVLKAELIKEEEYLSYIKDLVSSSFENSECELSDVYDLDNTVNQLQFQNEKIKRIKELIEKVKVLIYRNV